MDFFKWFRQAVPADQPQQTRSLVEGPFSTLNAWLASFIPRNDSGVPVSETTAMQSAAVQACVKAIAEGTATLDIEVLHDIEPLPKHRNYNLLNQNPTDLYSGLDFKQTITHHAALLGNGYGYLRKQNALVYDATVLSPFTTFPFLDEAGELAYYAHIDGRQTRVSPDRILHIKGFSPDGLRGYSPIQLAAQQIGFDLALTQHGNRFFSNGATLKGFFTYPGKLTDDAKTELHRDFDRMHAGASNAWRAGLLDGGLDFKSLSVTPEEAQFLESRKYSQEDIARLWRCPPFVIGIRGENADPEQEALHFLKYCLVVWLERWEHECDRKLLTKAEQDAGLYHRFNTEDLLRTDKKTRYEAHNIGFQGGWLSTNDIHRQERLPLVAGGDRYYRPLNMAQLAVNDSPSPQQIMQGSQIQQITSIIQQVAAGTLPRDSAAAVLAFVLQDKDKANAEALLGSAGLEPPKPEPEPVQPTEPDGDEPKPEPDADEQRNLNELLMNEVRRLTTKETNALTRAYKKHSDLATWYDEFRDDHDRLIRSALEPIYSLAGSSLATLDKQIDQQRQACKTELSHVATTDDLAMMLEGWQLRSAEIYALRN